MRKQLDPAALAEHGNLVEQLLSSLCSEGKAPPVATFTSVVISLLANLCRGSASVTERVLGYFPNLDCTVRVARLDWFSR
jgi:hypothetical protein